MTVLTPSLICTVAAVQRQCYLMCGFIQQMWVNCAFSHFASLQKQLYYFLWDRKWKWAQSRETLICTVVLNKYRLSRCT